MTGVTWSASMSSFKTTRSWLLSLVMSGRSRWRTNGDRIGARRIWRSKPPSHRRPSFASYDHQRPPGSEGAPQVRQRPTARSVNDEVKLARPAGEVLAGVADHLVRADRPDQFHLACTAHAGDRRAA